MDKAEIIEITNGFLVEEFEVDGDAITVDANLKDTLGKAMFEIDDMIGVRVWIIDDNKVKRVENWDFKPLIVYRKGFKYLLKEIKIKEDQIKKMKIYSFKEINGKKIKLGDSLMLKKVNTYND